MFNWNRILVLIVLIVLAGTLSGCGSQSDGDDRLDGGNIKSGYSDITPQAAKERLDSDEEIILLDVRTQDEYDDSHIKDSILIPVDELEAEAPDSLADKDMPIFIYCRSGNRSATAAKILVELGYTNVFNLGGINDWPYETEK